jgi:hypothetical protein
MLEGEYRRLLGINRHNHYRQSFTAAPEALREMVLEQNDLVRVVVAKEFAKRQTSFRSVCTATRSLSNSRRSE